MVWLAEYYVYGHERSGLFQILRNFDYLRFCYLCIKKELNLSNYFWFKFLLIQLNFQNKLEGRYYFNSKTNKVINFLLIHALWFILKIYFKKKINLLFNYEFRHILICSVKRSWANLTHFMVITLRKVFSSNNWSFLLSLLGGVLSKDILCILNQIFLGNNLWFKDKLYFLICNIYLGILDVRSEQVFYKNIIEKKSIELKKNELVLISII